MCRKFIHTKFVKVLQCKQNNRKYVKQNILVRVINYGVQSLWQCYFTKEYRFFHLDHNLEDNENVFLILKINQGP